MKRVVLSNKLSMKEVTYNFQIHLTQLATCCDALIFILIITKKYSDVAHMKTYSKSIKINFHKCLNTTEIVNAYHPIHMLMSRVQKGILWSWLSKINFTNR